MRQKGRKGERGEESGKRYEGEGERGVKEKVGRGMREKGREG